jgi:hypothetical protein
VFLLTGLLTLGATAVALAIQPDSLLRLWLWAATHTAWPLRVEGREKLPLRGPAVLLFPRMRLGDLLWLFAATDRTLRFLLPPRSAQGAGRWLRPISLGDGAEGRRRAAQDAAAALARGEVVCLPEDERELLAETGGTAAPLIEVSLNAPGPFSRTVVRFGAAANPAHSQESC